MTCRPSEFKITDVDAPAPRSSWNYDVVFNPTLWRKPVHNPKPISFPEGPGVPPQPGPPFISDDPSALSALVEIMAQAAETPNEELHAIGSGWAFEDCARTGGIMVDTSDLNWSLVDVLDVRNSALTSEWRVRQGWNSQPTQLHHVEAGIRILDLCERLDAMALALPTLGGSNGQSLAGAFSTSTHGGDWQQPPFPDIVRAVHLVAPGGQEWWIEGESKPITATDERLRAVMRCQDIRIVRSDRMLDGVRVACGRFGVIYSVVLEVRRQFRVVQAITTPNSNAVLAALRQGQTQTQGGLFTPLFRMLNNDPLPANINLSDARGVPYSLQILFNSQRPSDVWVTRRWETTSALSNRLNPPYTSQQEAANNIITAINVGVAELGGIGISGGTVFGVATSILTLIGGPIGSLVGTALGANAIAQFLNLVAELDDKKRQGNVTFGEVLKAVLNAAWKIPGLNYLIPQIQGSVIEGQLRGGDHRGSLRGPHFRVATGWREDNDQTDFRSDSIELIFDATRSEYLDFLDKVLKDAPGFRQAGYVSLRPSLSSSALISMHNVGAPRAMSIEIASVKDLDGNDAWLAYVHQLALSYGGRPHWGQYNKLDEMDVEMLYGQGLRDWREALLTISGESTLCSNAFTRQRGLEPRSILRLVTSVKKTPAETITHLCNDDEAWSPVTVAEAISQIQRKVCTYVAVAGDEFSFIKVVSDGRGGFYLRTIADGERADNLDNLPTSTR